MNNNENNKRTTETFLSEFKFIKLNNNKKNVKEKNMNEKSIRI